MHDLQQAREEALAKELEKQKIEKELEVARLRAQQEKAKDKQAERVIETQEKEGEGKRGKEEKGKTLHLHIKQLNALYCTQDALRAKRNQEQFEREWRRKEREEAQKK